LFFNIKYNFPCFERTQPTVSSKKELQVVEPLKQRKNIWAFGPKKVKLVGLFSGAAPQKKVKLVGAV
jgi:hypothetical protein